MGSTPHKAYIRGDRSKIADVQLGDNSITIVPLAAEDTFCEGHATVPNIYGKPMELVEVLALLREGGGRAEAKGYKNAREPRLTTFRTIQVGSGGYQYEGIVRNISPRGALIEGLWNVPPGTPLTLEFGADHIFDAEARWSAGNRVGVKFAEAVEIDALIGLKTVTPARGRVHRAA
ncbi:MAG: PilZ domain-containing protein [Hyphomicrobiales bacterium]|nr:MAG: PilZ domain-containing protein [Hyphomicrobiales bacterium]